VSSLRPLTTLFFNLTQLELLVVCIKQTLLFVQNFSTTLFDIEKIQTNMVTTIVVDDDFDTVEVFSEFLMLRNIDVLGKAYNGLDGIKLYEKVRPDIVFSDIWMPKYDGFYLLTNLKKTYPDSKVIMVTADLTHETDEKLKKSKADSVIFKPFKINHVMEAIESTLKDVEQPITNRI